ncbi:hypothetical protein ACLOJK_000725, partial [Asimina triloba]
DMPQRIAVDRSSSQQQIRNRHTHCLGWNTPRRPREQVGTGDGSIPSARVREERGSGDGRRRRGSLTGVREKGLAYQGLRRGCRVTDLGRKDDCHDSDLGREDDCRDSDLGREDDCHDSDVGGEDDKCWEEGRKQSDGRWISGMERCRRSDEDGEEGRRRSEAGRRRTQTKRGRWKQTEKKREDAGDGRLDAGGGRGASWEDRRENRGLGFEGLHIRYYILYIIIISKSGRFQVPDP